MVFGSVERFTLYPYQLSLVELHHVFLQNLENGDLELCASQTLFCNTSIDKSAVHFVLSKSVYWLINNNEREGQRVLTQGG